jgi:hypothetical protein
VKSGPAGRQCPGAPARCNRKLSMFHGLFMGFRDGRKNL